MYNSKISTKGHKFERKAGYFMKFSQDFFIGAATAAHQVEGNNIHSDYWAQEHMVHTDFL